MISVELEKNLGDYMEPIWALLSEREQEVLRAHVSAKQFQRNELIYREGDRSEYLMCVVSGRVKIYKEGICGRNQIMRLINPTQYFGYRAYFAGEPYVTEAAAFEPATVLYVPVEVIVTLIHNNSRLAFFFIRELATDLGASDERTVSLTQKHIRGRLAETLVFLIDKYGYENDGATLNIYLAREDIASLSNMTTSNAIRTLSSFCREQIIESDGRKIKILDEKLLRQIDKVG